MYVFYILLEFVSINKFSTLTIIQFGHFFALAFVVPVATLKLFVNNHITTKSPLEGYSVTFGFNFLQNSLLGDLMYLKSCRPYFIQMGLQLWGDNNFKFYGCCLLSTFHQYQHFQHTKSGKVKRFLAISAEKSCSNHSFERFDFSEQAIIGPIRLIISY